MLIKNASVVLGLWFTIIVHVCTAQVKIQPSAAKGGTCSGSISVSIAGNAGSYTVSVYKMPADQLISTKSFQRGSHTFKNLCASDYRIDVEVAVDGGKSCKLRYNTSIASDCGNITLEGLEEAKHAPTDCQTKDGYLQFHRLDGPMGGNPPYQMNLYGPNGSLLPASASGWQNLGVGNYELRVKDAQDCEAHFSFTLGSESDAELVAYLESVNVDLPCGGLSNGALELVFVPEGAQYTWSNGATNQRLSNLPAGDYTLTLTNGQCTASRTFELRDEVFPPLTAIADILPVCPGASQGGSIRLQVTGGSEPYQVKWNTGWTGTFLNNLKEGTYTVTITDRCKSVKSESYQIIQAAAITIEETTMHTCPQSSTGSIQLNVSGGTAPYQYKWSTGAGANLLTGLNAGKYSVTVTDKGQCRAFENYEISSSNLSLEITDIQGCEGNNCVNAKVDIAVQGGVAPYGYLWTGPNNFRSHNQNLRNINAPGVYTIVITDAELCTYTKEVNLLGCNLSETFTVTPVIYPAGGLTPKGAIHLEVDNNTNSDLVYNWTGPGGFASDKKDLTPANGVGVYAVTITGPCPSQHYEETFEITECNLELEVESVNSECSGNGFATVSLKLNNVGDNDLFNLEVLTKGFIQDQNLGNGSLSFTIAGLNVGEFHIGISRLSDNCTVLKTINIPSSQYTATFKDYYIIGTDQNINSTRPLYCIRDWYCNGKTVGRRQDPYYLETNAVATDQGFCSGYGGCTLLGTEYYYGTIIQGQVSLKGNNCYQGAVCQMSTIDGKFTVSASINANNLGPATRKFKISNDDCILELYCPNSTAPLESYNVGKSEYKKATTPQEKCQGIAGYYYCKGILTEIDYLPEIPPTILCPRFLRGGDSPELSLIDDKKEIKLKYLEKLTRLSLSRASENDDLSSIELNKIHLMEPDLEDAMMVQKEQLTIYPNPFNDLFSIILPSSQSHQEYNLSLYTLQGRLIHQLTTTNHEVTLDLPNLPQGAYFLKVSSKPGELWVKKLIKIP